MIKLKIDGSEVTYDTLEGAKDAARESGLGLTFWRETFSECAENDAMWNEFLNDLWQSGAEDEAERLDRTFPKDAPRHWLLVAVTLDDDNPWRAFHVEWKSQGDEWMLPVVSSPAFAPWLQRVWLGKYVHLRNALGANAAKWPNDLLLLGLKPECANVVTVENEREWQAILEKRKEPKPGDEMTITLAGGVPMTFCWCPATTSEAWKKISGGEDFFWMGSPESEEERSDDETRHRVRLTQGFWMGKYEVTQMQWESVMGRNPSHFNGVERPVESVSWDDCQEFIKKINASGQTTVSLPTEVQWEYACRAGTTTPFSFGSTLNGGKANCDGRYPYGTSIGRYRQETSPVGEYAPNDWGLYDMHGNVLEWCQDWYGNHLGDATDPTGPASGTLRVLRGGCWDSRALHCRSALRFGVEPGGRHNLGLRLVCSAGPRR